MRGIRKLLRGGRRLARRPGPRRDRPGKRRTGDDLLVTSRASASRANHAAHVDLDRATVAHLRSLSQRRWRRVTVVVPTWAELRRVATPARLLGRSAQIVVTVRGERPPSPYAPDVTASALGAVITTRVGPAGDDGTTVRVRVERPVAVSDLIHAVAPHAGRRAVAAPRVAIADRSDEPFVVGNPYVRYAGIDDAVDNGGVTVPTTDIVLDEARRPPFPAVDTVLVNPRGFDNDPSASDGAAAIAADGSVSIVDDSGTPLVMLDAGAALSTSHIDRLRRLRHVGVNADAGADPATVGWVVAQLAAAGVPLVAPDLGRDGVVGLDPTVLDLMASVTPDVLADPLRREAFSICLRRAALQAHGPAAWWRSGVPDAATGRDERAAISVVLVTRRPHYLESALRQIARQSHPNVQVVLGLHGDGFDRRAVAEATAANALDAVVVEIPADVPFGEGLNRATDRCDGPMISKWDDDDDYGTEHITDLVLAKEYSGADMVGKNAEFTVLADRQLTVRRHFNRSERLTRHVAGGALLIDRATLDAIGGWRPVPRFVDNALERQLLDAGGTIYRTHGFGYLLNRHGHGHTWDPGSDYFLKGDDPRWPSDTIRDIALEADWRRSI